jgi:sugar (pentulose or hexulose) kinase
LNIKEAIAAGQTTLGIEFGSTRIKAVLIGADHTPIASGSHDWENRYENGVWSYTLQDIWDGLQDCYRDLIQEVDRQYGVSLRTIGAIGFSAMMHGYMAFDQTGNLLVPFRTWRNTMTGQASEELTRLLGFNIPQRWSAAHLYQAILNKESHVKDIDFLTTLAGYVHWKLTGCKVLGIGDASGMFPIDSSTNDYDADMLERFQQQVDGMGYPWRLSEILPRVLCAGEPAGVLTPEGAKLLDPSGQLQPGIPLCPPEGDAGTGMVATNSVAVRTGNVSVGTSIFAMVVLEKKLSKVYPEIDMVTTPTGKPVAMVHCNNCTSDLNAWMDVFEELSAVLGAKTCREELFSLLFGKSLEGDADCGGLVSYNYFSGEPITQLSEGRPMLVRGPESRFTLANLMRTHLYSTMATLKLGLDILSAEEVAVDKLLGHGGLFKTPGVAQRYLAAAAGAPVAVMETAGEGGAWGIALLAAYLVRRAPGESLESYLADRVFVGMDGTELAPDASDIAGFDAFLARYRSGLAAERAAVENL